MKKVLKLEKMGYFGQEQCAVIIKDGKIFCVPETQKDFCDGSQWGWGMSAFCPLCGFNIQISDRAQLKSWAEHCKMVGIYELVELLEKLI
jgi:hypothetical protein